MQKSLDNLNCELRERNHKPEQVFLLRLHYENFDCYSDVHTTELSVAVKEAKYRDRFQTGGAFRQFQDRLLPLMILIAVFLSI